MTAGWFVGSPSGMGGLIPLCCDPRLRQRENTEVETYHGQCRIPRCGRCINASINWRINSVDPTGVPCRATVCFLSNRLEQSHLHRYRIPPQKVTSYSTWRPRPPPPKRNTVSPRRSHRQVDWNAQTLATRRPGFAVTPHYHQWY